MTNAEELLATLDVDEALAEQTDHIVVGTDGYITVPSVLQRIAVQGDHNVETATIDCPRYWDGRDLSTMKIYVNYLRADGEAGSYHCDNVTIDPTDSNLIHFDWVITENATVANGQLSFLICAKKINGEVLENCWHSELNQDMVVSRGMKDVEESTVTKYPDIITQLLVRMDIVEDKADIINEERIHDSIYEWLDEHPEATTTVRDGSLTAEKFTDDLALHALKDYVTPQMFGAKGDGVNDDTDAIRSAIKSVYEPTGTWTGCKKIFFPKGKYLVTDPIIESGMGVYAGQFVFEGENEYAVKIISQADVLFDNVGVFGFTKFENITFSGNDTNTLMNGVGGGTGNAQSFVFENCRFLSFHTVMNVTGPSMMSEVTFNTCKIKGCGSTDNPCEIFVMNNEQAVNWRFFGTDIESFTGTLISLYAGTTMYFYQGSIIPTNGNIIKIPHDANPNLFGRNNSPCCVFNGVRFELRKSTLIDANAICRPVIVFRDCGMGGYNLGGVTPIIGDGGSFDARFENCFNLSGFKYDIQNIKSTLGDAAISKMQFNNCDIDVVSFINNSSYTLISANNNVAVPAVVVNGREYRKVIGRTAGAKVAEVLLNRQGFYVGGVISPEETYNIYGTLIGLRLVSLGISSYGTGKITYTFKDGGTVLGTAEVAIRGGMVEIPVGKHVDVLTVEATIPPGTSQVIAPIQIIASII